MCVTFCKLGVILLHVTIQIEYNCQYKSYLQTFISKSSSLSKDIIIPFMIIQHRNKYKELFLIGYRCMKVLNHYVHEIFEVIYIQFHLFKNTKGSSLKMLERVFKSSLQLLAGWQS